MPTNHYTDGIPGLWNPKQIVGKTAYFPLAIDLKTTTTTTTVLEGLKYQIQTSTKGMYDLVCAAAGLVQKGLARFEVRTHGNISGPAVVITVESMGEAEAALTTLSTSMLSSTWATLCESASASVKGLLTRLDELAGAAGCAEHVFEAAQQPGAPKNDAMLQRLGASPHRARPQSPL